MFTVLRMNELKGVPLRSGLRTATATLCSVSAHFGIAVLILSSGGTFGQSVAPSESISVNVVHTMVLDAITETSAEEPPAASMAQSASVRADGPPEETVPAPTPQVDAETARREAEAAAAVERNRKEAEEARKAAAARAEEQRKEAEAQALEEARQRAEAEALDAARRAEETRLAELSRRIEKAEREEAARKEEAREAEAAKRRAEEARKEVERKEAELKRDKELAEARRADERRKEEAKRKRAAAAKETRAASVASPGRDQSKSGKGRASASQGDILSYAALVRARVAANRPSGSGQNGTVVVSFGISSSGGITHVSISRSSGSATLDNAARSAVRSAGPFPPPPNGAGRSFSVPFHFQ